MRSEMKPGDKVKCIYSPIGVLKYEWIEVGMVFTVKSVDENGLISFKKTPKEYAGYAYFPCDFTLVSENGIKSSALNWIRDTTKFNLIFIFLFVLLALLYFYNKDYTYAYFMVFYAASAWLIADRDVKITRLEKIIKEYRNG